jgi:hypothetical protein
MFAFQNAKMVDVAPNGHCGAVTTTAFMTPGGLRHMPPYAYTHVTGQGENDGSYVLLLFGTDQTGAHRFVGMHGGEAALTLPADTQP